MREIKNYYDQARLPYESQGFYYDCTGTPTDLFRRQTTIPKELRVHFRFPNVVYKMAPKKSGKAARQKKTGKKTPWAPGAEIQLQVQGGVEIQQEALTEVEVPVWLGYPAKNKKSGGFFTDEQEKNLAE